MTITYQTKSRTIPANRFRVIEIETDGYKIENNKVHFTDKRTGDGYIMPVHFIIKITE